jgi:ATP-dependent protease HslVU (ClpYQ) peptidase subunit
MTCIVVLNQDGYMYMAGERAVSNEDVVNLLSTPKIFKQGEYLIGFAGHMSGMRLMNSFNPPQPKGLKDKALDLFMNTTFLDYATTFYTEHNIRTDNLDLLIAVGNRIYEHSTDNMSLYTYAEPYASIGSGSAYAMGSLFSSTAELSGGDRVRLALKAAIKYSPGCAGKIDLIKVKV